MSKRGQEQQGGGERYGFDQQNEMADAPKQATAAQMARRKIASAKGHGGPRSRSTTPIASSFAQAGQQQSMPSFQPPEQSSNSFGGAFNFASSAASNPFAQQNGTASTPPPTTFSFGAQPSQAPQQNGGGGLFGNNNNSFGSTFSANTPKPQQNGFNPSTSSIFGQNQSNGNAASSFKFGQNAESRPQQNGLSPSTNNSFPSFGKQNSDNPFKGFGQTQSQQQTQSTPSTSFGGFGQNTQQNGEKTASTPFTFGQTNSQPQANGDKPLFEGLSQAEQTPTTSTGNLFSGIGQQAQQNGNSSLFPSTSQPEQTSRPASSSSMFGSQQNGGKGLFGATPPASGTSTPKPGESVFSAFNESKKGAVSQGMFTSGQSKTPEPSPNNIFGQPPPQTERRVSGEEEQTPKPANIFSGLNQPPSIGVKSNIFGTAPGLQSEQPIPKPSSSMFGGFGTQTTSQESSAPKFTFGQSQQDTSMTTPGNTPQKPLGSTDSASDAQRQAPTSQAGSMFARANSSTRDAGSPFKPSTSMFGAPGTATQNKSSADEQSQTPAPSQGGSLFDRITPADPPATAFKPSPASLTPQDARPSSSTGAPWLSHTPSQTPATPASTTQQPATAKKTSTTEEVIPESQRGTLKVLNEGLKVHLAKQDPNADWSLVMQYYLKEAAKIRKKPTPIFDTAVTETTSVTPNINITAASPARPAVMSTGASINVFASTTPKAPPSTNLFSAASQQTPKSSNPPNMFNAPQTAPVNKKRPAEDDAEHQPPATEKRARSNEPTQYPKLPDNASETAKMFQAALDRPSGFTVPNQADDADAKRRQLEKEAKEKAEREKKESEERQKQSTVAAASAGGFMPATGGFKPVTGFKPSTSGFTPTASPGPPKFAAPSGGSGGFLAAFGKKASEEEEKARKKRKDEDYDSDDETEEAWAARDAAEQEAKRKQIMEAAKSGPGFVFSRSATPASATDAPAFTISRGGTPGFGETDDVVSSTETETPANKGGSLFDRITPREPPTTAPSKLGLFSQTVEASPPASNVFASKTPSAFGGTSNATNIFSQFAKSKENGTSTEQDKAEGEKDQGQGDNTWKPDTPIKFGGNASAPAESTTPAAPPPFGNLFGTAIQKPAADSGSHLNVPGAKPTFGFNFGAHLSPGTSRASTPGVTTDGEGASTAGEGEDEDAPPAEPQVEDQTGLQAEERSQNDVLYEVAVAKCMKWGEKKDGESMVNGWVDKGKGPLFVLKNKDTGKVRVLLKIPPYGTARMNFEPLKGVEYEVKGVTGKMVQGPFVDHLDAKDAGKISKWMIQVGKAEDAEEIAQRLIDGRPS